jgi:hypothetical protein
VLVDLAVNAITVLRDETYEVLSGEILIEKEPGGIFLHPAANALVIAGVIWSADQMEMYVLPSCSYSRKNVDDLV